MIPSNFTDKKTKTNRIIKSWVLRTSDFILNQLVWVVFPEIKAFEYGHSTFKKTIGIWKDNFLYHFAWKKHDKHIGVCHNLKVSTSDYHTKNICLFYSNIISFKNLKINQYGNNILLQQMECAGQGPGTRQKVNYFPFGCLTFVKF